MTVFDRKSRYLKHASLAMCADRHGRAVTYVTPAEVPAETELGQHRLRQGQRLDHMANHYLNDPAGFWRIAEINDAMTAEAALDTVLVKIPTKV